MWLRSWDRDHYIEKNYKAQLSINPMLKDVNEKIKPFSRKEQKKKIVKIIRTKFDIKIKWNKMMRG